MNEDDLAFDTLQAVRAELAPEIDADLIQKCYSIQKSNQFSSDRSISLNLMDRLIDEYVDKIMATRSDGEA